MIFVKTHKSKNLCVIRIYIRDTHISGVVGENVDYDMVLTFVSDEKLPKVFYFAISNI